jgi:MYXO-CTERM domain-containing protein
VAYQGPRIIPAGALARPAAAATGAPINPVLLNPFGLIRAGIRLLPVPQIPVRPPVPSGPITSGGGPARPTPGPVIMGANPTQQNVAASGPIYNANGQPVASSGGGFVAPPSNLSMATPDGSGGSSVTATATFPVWGWGLLALAGLYLVRRGGG